MAGAIKKTIFNVDPSLCSGCGTCAAACPLDILEVQDSLCRMTKSFLCLECNTCMRECPRHAISISSVTVEEAEADENASPGDGPAVFTHVLDRIMRAAEEAFRPHQVFSCGGIDVADLASIDAGDVKGFTRCYQAPKLLKMYQQRLVFFDQMCVEVFGVVPDRNYDLPIFMFDWSESADSVFFVCDFYPTDDPGRNQPYLEKYLYAPLEEIYERHSSIPGLKTCPLHWVRAINSPYMLFGTVEKQPRENIGRLLNCAVDYLNAWIGLWKEAVPLDADSSYMKLVHERRNVLRRLYLENDPGIGSVNKFIGEEKGKRILELIVPE
ncbi:MAG: 4Fe-4S binding protein [Pseudomonadota bacterium]